MTESIGEMIANGCEHVARAEHGDEMVDAWHASQGIDVHAARCERECECGDPNATTEEEEVLMCSDTTLVQAAMAWWCSERARAMGMTFASLGMTGDILWVRETWRSFSTGGVESREFGILPTGETIEG
jgi:hypothetical protein